MNREGPPLELLLHRLTETPPDFLEEPRRGNKGTVHVAAVAGDLCRALGITPDAASLVRISERAAPDERAALGVTLLLSWLLSDEWFRRTALDAAAFHALLEQGARELAQNTGVRKFLEDPDRREELCRFALARLGFRPQGETRAQAEDRLTSLSATERARVLQASRAAEQRARAIREALAKKAAEESADKWTRE